MNRTYLFLSLLMLSFAGISAQSEYYSSIDMVKGGADLKNALFDIISNHKQISYGSGVNATWGAFYTTDAAVEGNKRRVLDMYSSTARYFGAKGESVDGMNIEHSVAKSWWNGEQNNAYYDLHHLNPSDQTANSKKSNYPLGELTSVSWNNGVAYVGKAVIDGKSENAFEPCDEYKGDFARTYMYMFTCYQNFKWRYTWMNYEQSSYPTLKPWAVEMLLQWHKQDPVSDKEIARNNAVYDIQGNRNPYIDYPQLADYVWGDSVNYVFNFAGNVIGGGGTEGGGDDNGNGDNGGGTGSLSGKDFELVTDASLLSVGDSVIITYDSFAMGAQYNKYRLSVDIDIVDGKIDTYSNEVQVVVLQSGSIDNTFALYVGDGYLAAASSSSNNIATVAQINDNASWLITVDSSGNAQVVAQGSYQRNVLQYNVSSPRFSCYKGTQKSVKIYAKSQKNETSIDGVGQDESPTTIYNSRGVAVRITDYVDMKSLPSGVYIINNKKVFVK
jgi:endonuclease I